MWRLKFLFGCTLLSFILKGQNFNINSALPDKRINSEAGCAFLFFGDLPPDTTADLVFYGEEENQHFGMTVSSAGDFNQDGYDDILIGAENGGRAYLCLGGPDPDAIPDMILQEEGHTHFGECVASVGDVNGDSFQDIAVGDCQDGLVQVYLGNSDLQQLSPFEFLTHQAGSIFKSCISSAGDFNGDGYDDIIVGDFRDDTYGTYTGCARVFFGGDPMDSQADLLLQGTEAFLEFGQKVACAGDVNGDGFSDIMVGAPRFEIGNDGQGCIYLYFGNEEGDIEPDLQIIGKHYQWIGYYMAGAGDVNNDGYDDIVVGAPYDGNSPFGISYVSVYYGGEIVDTVPDIVIREMTMDFGNFVTGIGDFNHDKYDDIMICQIAWLYEEAIALIYFGGEEMDTFPAVVLYRPDWGSYYGNSISGVSAGRFNEDTFTDILIGAPYYDTDITSIGPFRKLEHPSIEIYPNPFNSSIILEYRIDYPGLVRVGIFDMHGREIAVPINKFQPEGEYKFEWEADGFQPGIYFCTISSEQFNITRKMILVR